MIQVPNPKCKHRSLNLWNCKIRLLDENPSLDRTSHPKHLQQKRPYWLLSQNHPKFWMLGLIAHIEDKLNINTLEVNRFVIRLPIQGWNKFHLKYLFTLVNSHKIIISRFRSININCRNEGFLASNFKMTIYYKKSYFQGHNSNLFVMSASLNMYSSV